MHGDVALDQEQGSAIVSTERLFAYLLPLLRPARIVLAGEVAGVYTADPQADASASLVPLIDRTNIVQVREMLGGSHGVDVTGGMVSQGGDHVWIGRRKQVHVGAACVGLDQRRCGASAGGCVAEREHDHSLVRKALSGASLVMLGLTV